MEWLLLLADVALIGLLVRLWSNYQVHANDLKRRHRTALQRAEEHQQQIGVTRQEIAAVEAQLFEIEAQTKPLRGEVVRAEERLARLEMIEGGQH